MSLSRPLSARQPAPRLILVSDDALSAGGIASPRASTRHVLPCSAGSCPRVLSSHNPWRSASSGGSSSSSSWPLKSSAMSGSICGVGASYYARRRRLAAARHQQQPEKQQHCCGRGGGRRARKLIRLGATMEIAQQVNQQPSDTLAACAEQADIVQFDSAVYYVEEDEETLVVDVVRLGLCQDTIEVSYFSKDGSAIAGKRYEAVSGRIVFGPGEVRQSINVPLICSDDWNTTLEFQLKLSDPKGCELGRYLFVSRVKVIDNDLFPSNRFEEEFRKLGPYKFADLLPDFDLTVEYLKLNYSFEGVKEKTLAALTIDLLQNLYYLLTIYLLKYAADDVLGKNPELPLLVENNTEATLFAVGVLYVAPYLVLNVLDYYKSQFEIAEDSQRFLQDNIFRKFSNYSERSRNMVNEAEMGLTMIADVPDIVENGYMKCIEIAKYLGKLAVSSYFIIGENPDAEVPLFLAGVATFTFVTTNYRQSVDANEAVSDRQAEIMAVCQETNQKFRLIADYYMRPQVQDTMEDRTSELKTVSLPAKAAAVSNDFFPGWISTASVCVYLTVGGKDVVEGDLQIGAFLATINAVKDIGDSFKDIFSSCLDVGKAIGPIRKVTQLLNLPTCLLQLKAVNRERRRLTRETRTPEKLKELRAASGQRFGSDAIPIRLEGMSFSYEGSDKQVLKNVNLSVPQGKLVSVVGTRRGGKSTFMKMLGQVLFPTEGVYFVPSYLRILHVGEDPMLLQQSLWSNLAIGQTYWKDRATECDRVMRICRRIGLSEGTLVYLEELKDDFVNGIDVQMESDWQDSMSNSEKVLISLARALIYNPEVLVMNRPTQRLPSSSSEQVVRLITEYVRNRGVDLPADPGNKRRPRTAFVSFVRFEGVRQADVIWKVEDGAVNTVDQADVDLHRELMG